MFINLTPPQPYPQRKVYCRTFLIELTVLNYFIIFDKLHSMKFLHLLSCFDDPALQGSKDR